MCNFNMLRLKYNLKNQEINERRASCRGMIHAGHRRGCNNHVRGLRNHAGNLNR